MKKKFLEVELPIWRITSRYWGGSKEVSTCVWDQPINYQIFILIKLKIERPSNSLSGLKASPLAAIQREKLKNKVKSSSVSNIHDVKPVRVVKNGHLRYPQHNGCYLHKHIRKHTALFEHFSLHSFADIVTILFTFSQRKVSHWCSEVEEIRLLRRRQ